jgi:hypothetical protein
MTANQSPRPASAGRSSGPRLAAALIAALAVGACAGENLFTGSATVEQGPEVTITAPAANASLGVGDSIQVSADITGSRGLSQVKFSGTFSGGSTAFTEQIVTIPNPPDTSIARFLRQAGATTGNVNIIVEATDVLGDKGADTVAVVIN